LLLATSLAVTAGATEMVLRACGLPRPLPTWARIANTKGTEVRAGTVSLICYPTNPRGYFTIDLRRRSDWDHYAALGMRRMENIVDRQPFAVEHRYNSLVFRGSEFGARRPGVRRVTVIGDSFTEGWGVHEEDAYPRVLEGLLDAKEPGQWEVLNCGRANADFPALYMSVFKKAIDLDPDVVVYGMTLNDPVQTGRVRARRPTAQPPARLPLRLLQWADQEWRGYELTQATTRWYQDLFSDDNFNGWAETKSYMRSMRDVTHSKGAAFVVALWPMLVGLEGRYPFAGAHEKVARFTSNSDIRLFDLLPALRGRTSASLWVHAVDVHPNEIAHRRAAEALVPVIRDAYAAHRRSATRVEVESAAHE
jgi:lysophospholipase L1-like esterase